MEEVERQTSRQRRLMSSIQNVIWVTIGEDGKTNYGTLPVVLYTAQHVMKNRIQADRQYQARITGDENLSFIQNYMKNNWIILRKAVWKVQRRCQWYWREFIAGVVVTGNKLLPMYLAIFVDITQAINLTPVTMVPAISSLAPLVH